MKVTYADDVTEGLLTDLMMFYTSRTAIVNPGTHKPGDAVLARIAWLDSVQLKVRIDAEYVMGPAGQLGR